MEACSRLAADLRRGPAPHAEAAPDAPEVLRCRRVYGERQQRELPADRDIRQSACKKVLLRHQKGRWRWPCSPLQQHRLSA